MVHISVVDYVSCYLQHHIYHSPQIRQHLLIVPPSLFQMIAYSLNMSHCVDLPLDLWTPVLLPTQVLLPVVEEHNGTKHWYLCFADISTFPDGSHSMCIRYIDSLGRPDNSMLQRRLKLAGKVIRIALPKFKGKIVYMFQPFENFLQAPGSLDCGLFCCQAMSAIGFEQPGALDDPLPTPEVRARMTRMLREVRAGVLDHIAQGTVPTVGILLHNVQQRKTCLQSMDSHTASRSEVYALEDIAPVGLLYGWPTPRSIEEGSSHRASPFSSVASPPQEHLQQKQAANPIPQSSAQSMQAQVRSCHLSVCHTLSH
jgi:hypothetical protein